MERVLDFVSRWAQPFGREWFRIMEWLLVISALGLAESLTESKLIKSLWGLSVAVLWVYIMFGYSEAWVNRMRSLPSEAERTPVQVLALGGVSILVLIGVWFLADILTDIAVEFATKLSRVAK